MRIPGASRAYVAPAKLRDYLLSATHPIGGSKARFFARVGLGAAAWPALRRAIEAIAADGEAEPGAATLFGQKYVVRGTIQGPGGRAASIVTIWIVLATEDFPRFITAYPEKTHAQ